MICGPFRLGERKGKELTSLSVLRVRAHENRYYWFRYLGLGCAYLLKNNHDIILFGQENLEVMLILSMSLAKQETTSGYWLHCFQRAKLPNFVRLLELLDVDSQPTRMGFSVRSERTGIEYSRSHPRIIWWDRKYRPNTGAWCGIF